MCACPIILAFRIKRYDTARKELHLCRQILSENKKKARETIEILSANALHTQRE